MAARRKPKLEYSIVCDDIRQEINNKLSFIGIYGSLNPQILVSKVPFLFPKLCFVMCFKNVKAGDKFATKLIGPSGKELGKAITGTAPKGTKSTGAIVFFALYTPLKVEEEGAYKLLTTFNEDEKARQEITFKIIIPEKSE